jgi:DNA-directed RNA polymerase specialized sigma24 family protein
MTPRRRIPRPGPSTATLLTADRHAAEDVYQETLQRLFARWPRVGSPGRSASR